MTMPSHDSYWNFPAYYRLVPPEYIEARALRLGELCRRQELDGLLFTFGCDVYYACGTMQQGAALVTSRGETTAFIRRHAGRAAAESPVEVVPVSGFSQVARELKKRLPAGARLGLCLDVMSAAEYLGWQGRLPDWELVDVSRQVAELKGVKDAFEQDCLRQAGALAAECYALLPQFLQEGRTECWVVGRMLAELMARGHIEMIRTRGAYMETYSWHLVSGPEGTRPSAIDAAYGGYGLAPAFPQGPGLKPLRRGEPIVADIAACRHGYHTDQTRTYCLGPAPEPVREAHHCLEEVEKAIVAALRPGAVSGEIFQLAVDTARRLGFGDCFLGRPEQRISFVGHGLGLELGTPPYLLKDSTKKVQAGQAYALELKIVLDQGPVGLENTYLVTPQGPPELLSTIPNQLFEL